MDRRGDILDDGAQVVFTSAGPVAAGARTSTARRYTAGGVLVCEVGPAHHHRGRAFVGAQNMYWVNG